MCLIEMVRKGASGARRLLVAFEAAVRHQARHSGCRNQDIGAGCTGNYAGQTLSWSRS